MLLSLQSIGVLSSFFINTSPGEGDGDHPSFLCSEVVSPILLPSHYCGRGNVFGDGGPKRVRQI